MDLALSDEETRVLGALIEKQLSTPEYYPMTANALVNACNQKSNRDPVVSYSESDVLRTLDSLQRRKLAGRAVVAGSRTTKFRHALVEAWQLNPGQLAVLASLMLRGPQTAGELRNRTTRMHQFESLDSVLETLNELSRRDPPVVKQRGRQPGQKETRYAQLLSDMADEVQPRPSANASAGAPAKSMSLHEQVAKLETRVADLEAAFESFRKQFE